MVDIRNDEMEIIKLMSNNCVFSDAVFDDCLVIVC